MKFSVFGGKIGCVRKVRIKRNDSTHENIATEQESELENAAVAIAEKEAAIAERDKRLAELESEIEKARKERAQFKIFPR